MADEAQQDAPGTEPEQDDAAAVEQEEQRIPYERFQKENRKAKEAAQRAKQLETELADIRQQMEERESAGLPELERMKKDLDRAMKRAEEAEKRAAEQEQAVARSQRERWVTAAAKDFIDPDDATRYVDLEDLESPADAERAVKRVAKLKPHLLRQEETRLPGRVLNNGQRVDPTDPVRSQREEEGSMILDGIRNLTRNWQSGGPI